jgi:ubiquitin-like 1-activating enzyme E1 A
MRGLAAEVAKNLVLAGIGSLMLLDGASVSLADLSANFLVRAEDVGRNRAEACVPQLALLNPNVAVSAVPNSAEATLRANPKWFAQFRAVLLVGQSIAVQTAVSKLLREHGAAAAGPPMASGLLPGTQSTAATNSTAAASIASSGDAASASTAAVAPVCPAFFSGECVGLSGFFFEDLQRHAFSEARRLRDPATGKETDEETITHAEQAYERTVDQVLDSAASGQTVAELAKKFGRRSQEKAACALWLALRTTLQWREAQLDSLRTKTSDALVGAVAAPAVDDPAVLASLVSFRDAALRLDTAAAERALPASVLASIARTLHVELAHVCAIVGGILGQEILKVLSGKDRPLSNTFVCSATEGFGLIKEL